ncbi:DUF4429 domain-containing protein [Enterococcus thailandicus]|uniref:DUF4429 domain-containing protein n=1 Tax=Enterococcus thailandicus TaxID=417368 RepID=A0A179ERN2_ENTTH|nr:DUF4429 domain-containing protein [Enterococcus thailandicus]OAQ55530.1 hypothetical protein A6E74_08560 [Enterococcus thailandicus]
MGLFDGKTKNEKKDLKDSLFEPTEKEKVFEIKHAKAIIRIDDNFVRIARKSTFTNVLLQGLDGEKSIVLGQVTAYQLKAPGKTTGYLQIIYPGSQDTKGGVFDAVKDENTIIFLQDDIPKIKEIKDILEAAIIRNIK